MICRRRRGAQHVGSGRGSERGSTEFIHAQVLWRAGRIEQAHEAAGKARAHFEAAAAQHLLADLDAWLAEVGER